MQQYSSAKIHALIHRPSTAMYSLSSSFRHTFLRCRSNYLFRGRGRSIWGERNWGQEPPTRKHNVVNSIDYNPVCISETVNDMAVMKCVIDFYI